jgi:hypothetical protein
MSSSQLGLSTDYIDVQCICIIIYPSEMIAEYNNVYIRTCSLLVKYVF